MNVQAVNNFNFGRPKITYIKLPRVRAGQIPQNTVSRIRNSELVPRTPSGFNNFLKAIDGVYERVFRKIAE